MFFNVFGKWQIVQTFDFAHHMASIAIAQLCCCSAKQPKHFPRKRGCCGAGKRHLPVQLAVDCCNSQGPWERASPSPWRRQLGFLLLVILDLSRVRYLKNVWNYWIRWGSFIRCSVVVRSPLVFTAVEPRSRHLTLTAFVSSSAVWPAGSATSHRL